MKINIELNQKSIKEAKKQLLKQKKILQEQILPEYMRRTAEWIIKEANTILSRSDIGIEVVQDIMSKWRIDVISNSHIMIRNMSWKSTFVEFGVGIVAQTSKHPNADVAGYEYNVNSEKKFGQGHWQFTVDDQSFIDIPKDAIIYQNYTDDGLSITTQGTQGVWFLFNAVENFKLTEQKRLWEEITRKYLN
jgi:hypothetical protein